MRRFVVGMIGFAVLVLTALGATPARADDEDWEITRFDIAARVDQGGTTAVTLDFDFRFNDSGRGPYITLPLRQGIKDDPDQWRMLDVEVGSVTSPSGANTEVSTTTEDGNLLIRVGNEDVFFTGVQRYVITYSIRGLIAPRQAVSGLDEFNWNAVGTAWEIPLNNVTVSLTGPAQVSRTACFTGADFRQDCQQHGVIGDRAGFSQNRLEPGQGLQVAAGFPAGTFVGAEPRFEKRFHPGNMFPLTPVTGGLTAALTALGLGWLALRTRRGSRDQVYLGLTPGLEPTAADTVTIGSGSGKTPVAVAFTPPAGARPGEIGVLIDAVANDSDVAATVIDLATRGHLRIEQNGEQDWTFHRLTGADELVSYEQHFLDELFALGSVVSTAQMQESEHDYSAAMSGMRTRLYRRVSGDLHWFTKDPSHVRGLAVVGGTALVVAGIGLGFALGLVGFGLVGAAGIAVGIGVLAMSAKFGSRTATGSAVLAQAKGFELYLTTAEADQIKFEEGIDVFSRYLPYAIVFGVAERWTKIFADLEAQGRYVPDHSWYLGYGYGMAFHTGFVSSLDSLASTMSSSMQAPSAATSGGSGFSGGGGFGGGGGGGW